MKYKLLLIAIFITIIRSEAKPTTLRTGLKTQIRDELTPAPNKLDILKPSKRSKIRVKVDKSGNKWAFDENSQEWMHLPKQPTNSMTSNTNLNREEEYPDQSLPIIYSLHQIQKGQQNPGRIQSNSQSIYGPHFPNSFPSIKNPGIEYGQDDSGSLSHDLPIYGPLPLPGGIDSNEEDESEESDPMLTWQNFHNYSNSLIPGPDKYPNPLTRPNSNPTLVKTSTQNPRRENVRDKPLVLEEFDDPFETEYTNKPKYVKTNNRLSTTTNKYDENFSYHPLLPTFGQQPSYEDDIELEPFIPGQIEDNQREQKPSSGNRPVPSNRPPSSINTNTNFKPSRKPIVKIPLVPEEPSGFWTILNEIPISTSTLRSLSTTTDLFEQDHNNLSGDIIELYPPVPPEQPGNLDFDDKKSSSTNSVSSTSKNILTDPYNPKEIKSSSTSTAATTSLPSTTTTTTTTTKPPLITTPSPTTTTETATSPPTISSTLPKIQTTIKEPVSPTVQKNPTIMVNNPGESIFVTTRNPWRPITLGRRHQTPVPIVQYPTIMPSAQEVWQPVMGPYSPIKVPDSIDSIWVRPTMGGLNANIMNVMAITTKKVLSTTTTHPPTTTSTTTTTSSPTDHKRKVVKKKITKTTTEMTTTTEKPKTIKHLISKRPKKTSTIKTTTTTQLPTSLLSTHEIQKVTKRAKKPKTTKIIATTITTTTTTTTSAPIQTINTPEDAVDYSDAVNEDNESEHIAEEIVESEETAQLNGISSAAEEVIQDEPGDVTLITTALIDSGLEDVLDEDMHLSSEPIISEIPKVVPNENSEDSEEEETEETISEVSPQSTVTHNVNGIESDEIIEEEYEETSASTQIQTITEPIEEEVEELEEEEQILGINKPDKAKDDIKDQITGEVIEYEYEEVPETKPEEIEELVSDDDSEEILEETTKSLPKSIINNWQHIAVPMQRKGPPNLFPRTQT